MLPVSYGPTGRFDHGKPAGRWAARRVNERVDDWADRRRTDERACGRTGELADGLTGGRTDGPDGRTDEWAHRRADELADKQVDRQIDGRTRGRMNE